MLSSYLTLATLNALCPTEGERDLKNALCPTKGERDLKNALCPTKGEGLEEDRELDDLTLEEDDIIEAFRERHVHPLHL